jgi:hypothetical protein
MDHAYPVAVLIAREFEAEAVAIASPRPDVVDRDPGDVKRHLETDTQASEIGDVHVEHVVHELVSGQQLELMPVGKRVEQLYVDRGHDLGLVEQALA